MTGLAQEKGGPRAKGGCAPLRDVQRAQRAGFGPRSPSSPPSLPPPPVGRGPTQPWVSQICSLQPSVCISGRVLWNSEWDSGLAFDPQSAHPASQELLCCAAGRGPFVSPLPRAFFSLEGSRLGNKECVVGSLWANEWTKKRGGPPAFPPSLAAAPPLNLGQEGRGQGWPASPRMALSGGFPGESGGCIPCLAKLGFLTKYMESQRGSPSFLHRHPPPQTPWGGLGPLSPTHLAGSFLRG